MNHLPSLISKIESLLLIANQPLSFAQIAKLLDSERQEIQDIINKLKGDYEKTSRGFRIVNNDYKAELVTAPENCAIVNKLVDWEKSSISQAKIETLTILAYNKSLTKEELESIRGVNCSLILRNLKIEELIDEIEEEGAIKYQVSTKFLKMLGVTSVENLPDYQQHYRILMS